jgi:hypothetical protein
MSDFSKVKSVDWILTVFDTWEKCALTGSQISFFNESLDKSSEADGARTRNLWIDSPVL